MSSDKLVFDLSQEIDGSPNIFVSKSWLTMLDNQNGNYGAGQCTLDTSSLANSSNYLSYREAYLTVPMLLTLTANGAGNNPKISTSSFDYTLGLKNWFGSIVHSFSCEYNTVQIIQQTPFCNMWNSFKLMTSLSWSDVANIGSSIGFYPDDPLSWTYNTSATDNGTGVCNNNNFSTDTSTGIDVSAVFNKYSSGNTNMGFLKRQTFINFDPAGIIGLATAAPLAATYSSLLTAQSAANIWKSYISTKETFVNAGAPGVFQISIRATIYLKHLHSFFQMIPLLKGVFMKMTLTLNNSQVDLTTDGANLYTAISSSVPSGGVQPIMVSSKLANNGGAAALIASSTYSISLAVGSIVLNQTQKALTGVSGGQVGNNVSLYVPSYVFNPVFEQVYISTPVKTISYTDIYQYQILRVGQNGYINNLLTNGIKNIKSVLCLPFFSQVSNLACPNSGGLVYQSPFDPAGCGPTSPLCLLTNFNVVIAGQNMVYNGQQRYTFEAFNNQLLGCNSVNSSMTDGLSSGLIDLLGFEMEYCYHYINVSRCLPVEENVPKSVSIVGQNTSVRDIDLFCFVEYGAEIKVDVLTSARVM